MLFRSLLYGLLLFVAVGGVQAVEISPTAIFAWDYPNTQHLLKVKEFRVYSNTQESGAGWLVATVPYLGDGKTSFEARITLAIKGEPGTQQTRYFTMTAVGTDGGESARSNSVAFVFTIPYDIDPPSNLTVRR